MRSSCQMRQVGRLAIRREYMYFATLPPTKEAEARIIRQCGGHCWCGFSVPTVLKRFRFPFSTVRVLLFKGKFLVNANNSRNTEQFESSVVLAVWFLSMQWLMIAKPNQSGEVWRPYLERAGSA